MASDREHADSLVNNLQLFGWDSGLVGQLGDPSDASHRLVVDRGTHMLRIEVAPFEQQVELPPSVIRNSRIKTRSIEGNKRKRTFLDRLKAEKVVRQFPQFGLLLDLDAYIEEPPYPQLSISDFMSSVWADFAQVKKTVLSARQ